MGHSHRADAKNNQHNVLNICLNQSALFLPVDTFAPSLWNTRQSDGLKVRTVVISSFPTMLTMRGRRRRPAY